MGRRRLGAIPYLKIKQRRLDALLRKDTRIKMALPTYTPPEGTKQLREHGYRFIMRLGTSNIIVSPLDEDANYYLLFTDAGRADANLPMLRHRFYKFVKPVSQSTDPTLYLEARKEDERRKKKDAARR